MGWFEGFAYGLLAHPYILAFIGGTVIGEEATIFLSFLAGQGLINFWIVFVFGILGQIFFDNVLFLFVHSKIGRLVEKRAERKEGRIIGFIKKIGKNNPFLMLASSKFFYGTRILSMLYVIAHGIKYGKYFVYDAGAALIWASIMAPLGWLAGKGFSRLLNIATGAEKILGVAILAFLAYYLIERAISFWIIKKEV